MRIQTQVARPRMVENLFRYTVIGSCVLIVIVVVVVVVVVVIVVKMSPSIVVIAVAAAAAAALVSIVGTQIPNSVTIDSCEGLVVGIKR